MNQNLIDYIKKSKEQGISDEQIKSALLGVGWREEDIEEGFKIIGEAPIPTSSPAEFEPLRTEKLSQLETGIKKAKKPPTTLISIIFLLAGIGHLISIPVFLLFGLVGWVFEMMAIFSVISAVLFFICFVGLRKMKSWYLKPFLMLFGLAIIVGLVMFFIRWNPTYIIEILILAIIFWILWKQKEKFGYQPSVQFFKRWSFLMVGMVIGLILGGVILAEACHWITPKWEKIEEETEKEKITETMPEKWISYVNEEYGYQIDYPVDWTLYDKRNTDGLEYFGSTDGVVFQTFSIEEIKKRSEKMFIGLQYCGFQKDCLFVYVGPSFFWGQSLEEWINEQKNNINIAKEQGLNYNVKENEISIGGIKGYEFVIWIPQPSVMSAGHIIGIFNGGKMWEIRAAGLEETLFKKFPKTLEHIISSFRFTN